MSSIHTSPFGGGGGDAFNMAVIQEVGLRTGNGVDQIRINGAAHGGGGGHDRGSITLDTGEYISRVDIRAGEKVDAVVFTTSNGNTIGGGGSGGDPTTLDNIRVIGIGGSSGDELDKLNIMYVDKYQPSTVMEQNVGFILDFSPPFQKFEEYTDSLYKTVDSYEKITEHMQSQTYSASVEAEYYAKVSASTEIALTDTSTETIKSELETELKAGNRIEQTIPDGSVGVKLINGNLMQGADGAYWMFPISEPAYSVMKISDYANVLNHYDLTGELDTQMPDLKSHRTNQNGYVFYTA